MDSLQEDIEIERKPSLEESDFMFEDSITQSPAKRKRRKVERRKPVEAKVSSHHVHSPTTRSAVNSRGSISVRVSQQSPRPVQAIKSQCFKP
jgi:hypothetical protein